MNDFQIDRNFFPQIQTVRNLRYNFPHLSQREAAEMVDKHRTAMYDEARASRPITKDELLGALESVRFFNPTTYGVGNESMNILRDLIERLPIQ